MLRERASLLWGLVTGAIGVIAFVVSIVKLTTDVDVAPIQIGFYLGASAVLVYIAGFAGAFAGAMVTGAISALSKGESAASMVVGGIVGVAAALWLAYILIDANVIFNYDNTDAIGRGFMALIGLAGLCVAIYFWRRSAKKAKAAKSPAGAA